MIRHGCSDQAQYEGKIILKWILMLHESVDWIQLAQGRDQ
jgi:hypothetical protein